MVNNCKNNQGRYNGLRIILSDPKFLVYCYESIQGKPGDITPKTGFLGFAEKDSDGPTPYRFRLHGNCFFKLADTYTQKPDHK
jgi:hypothetical protein